MQAPIFQVNVCHRFLADPFQDAYDALVDQGTLVQHLNSLIPWTSAESKHLAWTNTLHDISLILLSRFMYPISIQFDSWIQRVFIPPLLRQFQLLSWLLGTNIIMMIFLTYL